MQEHASVLLNKEDPLKNRMTKGARMAHTLEEAFYGVYLKFQLQFFKRVFQRLESREARLTTVETFSVEVIDALGTPTVSEFAKFLNISVANATYKVQSLIKKGYLRKERSEEDRRESYLHVTERFEDYKSMLTTYAETVSKRIEESCTPEDIATFKRILEKVNNELTPEVELPTQKSSM
jgi:DNA-binding MarR family transcriptional regulator